MPRSRLLVLPALSAFLLSAPAVAQVDISPAGNPSLQPASIENITAQFRRHGLADAPAKPDGAVRLATYNIHDLFDDADDPTLFGRNEDKGRTMIESRRIATAVAIRKVDADILALQEVESLAALEWYRDSMVADLGYSHTFSVDVGHSIGLEQAVLSRFPIIATKTWVDRVIGEHPPLYRGKPNRFAGQPLTFRRSPLMAEIALLDEVDRGNLGIIPEADRLTLLVVHFKTGNGSEDWRAAEGRAIAEILAELRDSRPDRRIAVLGDFAVAVSEGHTDPILKGERGLSDVFMAADADPGTDSGTIATSIDGNRDCQILVGAGVSLEAGSSPFVVGTVVPPERLDRRMGFRMPGFASDHYPVACDLQR